MVDINVEARPHEIEPVNLGEFSYEFIYPKVSPLLSALQDAQHVKDTNERGDLILSAQDEWLADGFGPDQWAHIKNRLSSKTDPLDFPHILAMFDALFRKAADNRPPTWSGDSSKVSPAAFQRAATPKPYASTPGVSLSDASATS